MEVGKLIKRLRVEAGMSQEELALKTFVSRQTISNWENDKSYPDVQSLALIAGLFGTTIDSLVKGDLLMIDARIAEEDTRIVEEDVKTFKHNAWLSAILTLGSLIVAGVAFDQENWLALAMCGFIWALALYFAFLTERTKKKYDVQTYREIKAFIEGESLEEIRLKRVPRPTLVSVMWKLLLGACIGIIIGMLTVWLVRL